MAWQLIYRSVQNTGRLHERKNMVPFLDLKAQMASIKPEVIKAVESVIDSAQFVLGPEVKAFEDEFAAYCGVRHAVGVNSGTCALQLALLAAGVGPGDEVITVPHTFVATVAAIQYTGARPVFVDIDPESYTMDPVKIMAAMTPRTKAIMPVHLYGQPADMDPILEIARRKGVLVIEDTAQAHGAVYKSRRCGSMGDLAGVSFYPGKNLGACGEGGAVLTNNDVYARTVRMLRDWGQEKKYQHVLKGFNARLEGIQGAILRVKLRHLEKWTELRRAHAVAYGRLLANCSNITLPKTYPDRRHVYHIFAVRVKARDRFMKFLLDRGIHTAIHYPFAVHTLPAYADLGKKGGDFPEAEKAAAEVVSLPMFPEMTDVMIAEVVAAVKDWQG